MGYTKTGYSSGLEQSLATDWKSDPIDISYHTQGSLQLIWDSVNAFNATIIIEASNLPTPTTDSDWTELDGSCFQIDTASDNRLYTLTTSFDYRWIRLNYQANNVSTGTLDWYLIAKRG